MTFISVRSLVHRWEVWQRTCCKMSLLYQCVAIKKIILKNSNTKNSILSDSHLYEHPVYVYMAVIELHALKIFLSSLYKLYEKTLRHLPLAAETLCTSQTAAGFPGEASLHLLSCYRRASLRLAQLFQSDETSDVTESEFIIAPS